MRRATNRRLRPGTGGCVLSFALSTLNLLCPNNGPGSVSGATDPFALPPSWSRAKTRLDLVTPLNFVCTADITGGNSGSPIVNRAGDLVGVIFDSNRQGVADNFTYSDEQARAVAVDVRGIVEALRKVYEARELLSELLRKN